MLLFCLPSSTLEQDTEFLKYAKNYIRNGLLFCRSGGSRLLWKLAEYSVCGILGRYIPIPAKAAQRIVGVAEKPDKEDGATADRLLTVASTAEHRFPLPHEQDGRRGNRKDVTCDDS